MHLIRLSDLPPPPEGRIGWPWTEESPAVPSNQKDGRAWPSVSIVMPSFNQGRYLEEAIRSVLLQGYPNLEFLIIDGGSSDESVPIIRKYEPWLSGWVSEPDKGQSDAINKGFARINGDIFNWLCSDDLLRPGALASVVTALAEPPGSDVVAGTCYCLYEQTPEKSGVQPCRSDRFARNPYSFAVWQPSCFFRRSLIERSELVRTGLHYCMDRELWCYLWSRGARWKWSEEVLSVNRFTGSNKSMLGKEKILDELETVYRAYIPERVPLTFWLRQFWLPLVRIHKDGQSALVRAASRLLSRSISVGLRAAYPRDRIRVLQDEFYIYTRW